MQLIFFLLFTVFALLCAFPANAYVGPGLGLGALGVITGILASIILAIIGIFWYPIKRLVRSLRSRTRKQHD